MPKRQSSKPYHAQGRYAPQYRYSEASWLRAERRRMEEARAAAEARLFVGPMLDPRDHFADVNLAEVLTTPEHALWDEVMLYIEQYNAHAAKS